MQFEPKNPKFYKAASNYHALGSKRNVFC